MKKMETMDSYKISVSDMARRMGCSVSWLLALAEAGRIDLFARLDPFSAELRDRHGAPAFGAFRMTNGSPSYTVLLPSDIATLLSYNQVTLNVLRPEGAENGFRLLPEHDDNCLYWFDNSQVIGLDRVFIRDDAELPPDPVPATAPVQQKSELISRTAIQKRYPEISATKWRGLFEREKKNGLRECRVSDKPLLYDAEKFAMWVMNHRKEVPDRCPTDTSRDLKKEVAAKESRQGFPTYPFRH